MHSNSSKMSRLPKRRANHKCATRRRGGQTLVEFALIVPVLLAMLMGIIEFGWLVKTQLTVANAAREGIRYAALGNSSSNVRLRIENSATTLSPAITDSQITLEQTSDTTSSTPTYYAWPADTTATPPKNGITPGNFVRITVRYPHHQLTGFFPFLRNRIVMVQVSMAREGGS